MEGDAWTFPEIGIPRLTVHPMHLVDDDVMQLIELWRAWQGGLGGAGLLPDQGGVNDQAAWIMAAFNILSAAERSLSRNKGDQRRA